MRAVPAVAVLAVLAWTARDARADDVPPPAYLTGSRIVALPDGALVIDPDSGQLIRTDAADRPIVKVDVGRGSGLLVFDPIFRRAYVADRERARIAVIEVEATTLVLVSSLPTPAEPFGLAMSPDTRTLLVTSIADRVLVALDAASGAEQWREPIGAEPRGVSISPDGRRAMVAHLTTGAVDVIELGDKRKLRSRALRRDRFARGAFAVTFLGNDLAVAAFQAEHPEQPQPITRHLGFMTPGGRQTVAQISPQDPRALAWDARSDRLFVAGMGDDSILEVANASRAARAGRSVFRIGVDQPRCGPEGLAVADNGDVLVWCSLSRSIVRIDFRAKL